MASNRCNLGLIFAVAIAGWAIDCKDARALFAPPPGEAFASGTVIAMCSSKGGFWKCTGLGVLADPVGSDITDVSVGFQLRSAPLHI